jgi:ATP/ADP translocase
VVTAVGAEALPFLEAYGVLPLSLAFFMLYNWLVRHLLSPTLPAPEWLAKLLLSQ